MDVIAQITIALNADTSQIVDGDKRVVEEVVNIENANLIPIAKETRNAEDGVAKISSWVVRYWQYR